MPDAKKPRKGNGRERSTDGQPFREPINREASEKPALQPFIAIPNGGQAPRCQARKRDGTQCGAPARKGMSVCARHGAGMRPREATATAPARRAGGRPPTHGLYSKAGRRKIAEVVAELEAAQVDLDDSDGEMRVLRATLAFLLGQADVHEGAGDTVRGTYSLLERTLREREAELEMWEVKMLSGAMNAADRLMSRTESWVNAILDASRFVVKASKERAETRAKVAEARALEVLTKYIHVLRGIMWDSLDEEQLDVIEGRLLREVFAPNGLEMPDRDEPLVA